MSWEEVLIGDNCQVLSAKRIFAKDYVASGIPFYRSKEIIYKAFNQFENDEVFIKEERFNEIKNKFGAPKRGDVLISSVGNRSGISYWVKEEYDFYFKDGNLIWFRNFNDKMSSKYLVYFLNSELGQAKINNMFIGAAQKALTIEGVKRIKLSLPPSKTQKRIADILSSYDELIENNLKRIKLLEKAAQNIYKEWFVNMRFPGHENTPIDQETGLPEGWKECLLNEYIDFKEGPGLRNWQYRTEGIPFLNIRMMKSGDLNFSSVKFLEINEVEKKYNHFLLKEYDHIISTSGTLGKVVTIRKSHLPLCLNTSIIRLRPIRDEVGKWYIKRKVSCSNFLNEMKSFATGSAQLNFGPKHLNMMKIIVPSKFIGLEFEKLTNPIELKILSLLDYNQKLKKARDILLPRFMNQTIEV